MKKNLAITLLFALFVQTAIAAPGDLDPAFGSGGVFTDSPALYPCYGMRPEAMALQADGKILVAGMRYNRCAYGASTAPTSDERVLLRRYLANGSPDQTFGTLGFAVAQIGGPVNVYGHALGIEVHPDGRIVVVGFKSARIGTVPAVWQFTPQGELDTTFGTGGNVTFTAPSGYSFALKVAITGGKILIAGADSSGVIWLRKLNSNGTTDAGFNSGTKLETNLSYSHDSPGLVVNPVSGHIFVSGRSQITGGAAVAKFSGNGTVFANFGNFGISTIPPCTSGSGSLNPTGGAADMRIQGNGKLLVTYYAIIVGLSGTATGVTRLSGSGFVDTSFGPPMCTEALYGSMWLALASNDAFYSFTRRYFSEGQLDSNYELAITQHTVVGAVQPADGKIIYLREDVFPDQDGNPDTRVQLFRALP